jgi:23S rRNA (pseudouridine1915-N3)-methyltransferase
MKITIIVTGKTDFSFIEDGIKLYVERIKRYIQFDFVVVKGLKKTKGISEIQLKKAEGTEVLNKLLPGDLVVLLDEKGKEISSYGFSSYIENKINIGIKRLVFVIGGAYGFSNEVYERANELVSLSKMTYSHQIVRVIFLEQLYRAFTIIKGEPYHHE